MLVLRIGFRLHAAAFSIRPGWKSWFVSSRHLLDERAIAGILACLLSSIVLLGASAGPPIVSISSLSGIESGTTVRVLGTLIDHRCYDSGAEGLTLADLEDGAVLKIVSSPGIKPQPSMYARIGDELLIEGEVSINGSSVVVFASSDDVVVSRASELVLTVEALSRNWQLFDGDMVRVKGILELTGVGAAMRLRDLSCGCTITVLLRDIDLGPYVGSSVTLTAEVRYDYWLSVLTLVPSYVASGQ